MKTVVFDYTSVFLGLAEVVRDFPGYTLERSKYSEHHCDITIPKKRHWYSLPSLDMPKPEIEVYLSISDWGNETTKTSTIHVKQVYNKTLLRCINQYLRNIGFKTKLEMQI